MAFVPPKDRVLETSISNSQTVFALAGAVDASFNRFSASMSIGDTTVGAVVEPGVAFKSGKLTYSATNEITIDSTGFDSKGTFSAGGTKEVFMGIPAAIGGKLTAHGADIVAVSTLDLESATGEFLTVTGNTTITGITLGDGHRRTVYFSGSPLLVHSGSFVLFGGTNIQIQAGSNATFVGYGGAVLMTALTPASRVGAANFTGALSFTGAQALASGEKQQARDNAGLGASDVHPAAGIAFPATQVASSDPNTLDDYEEGTFTPTGIGQTFAAASGTYTKIGRVVHITASLQWSSTGAGNQAGFAGLPFVVGSVSSAIAVGSFNSATTFTMLAASGTSRVDLWKFGGGGPATLDSDMSTATVKCSGSYNV